MTNERKQNMLTPLKKKKVIAKAKTDAEDARTAVQKQRGKTK